MLGIGNNLLNQMIKQARKAMKKWGGGTWEKKRRSKDLIWYTLQQVFIILPVFGPTFNLLFTHFSIIEKQNEMIKMIIMRPFFPSFFSHIAFQSYFHYIWILHTSEASAKYIYKWWNIIIVIHTGDNETLKKRESCMFNYNCIRFLISFTDWTPTGGGGAWHPLQRDL